MERDHGLRITSIEVRGLFGENDHEIPILGGRPVVLTGRNGSGKSTILRLVNAVAEADVQALSDLPLDQFVLRFSNAPEFRLISRGSDGVQLQWGDDQDFLHTPDIFSELPKWALEILKESDYRPDVAMDLLMEARNPSFEFNEDEFARARMLFRRLASDNRGGFQIPDLLSRLADSLHTLYVTDQRLVAEDVQAPQMSQSQYRQMRRPVRRRPHRLAVEAASSAIANAIRSADSRYARTAQESERSFPTRVLRAMVDRTTISEEDLQGLITRVNEERQHLRTVGLLDEDLRDAPQLPLQELGDAHVRSVLATILESSIENMHSISALSAPLAAFKTFLDARFAPKQVVLDREEGMRIMLPAQQDLSRNTFIRPALLSSGEQQLTILAYEILFRLKKNTLVIIDEPELSLHLLWQDTLVNELKTLGQGSGAQFLMASHSPAIVASVPECEFSLDLSENE